MNPEEDDEKSHPLAYIDERGVKELDNVLKKLGVLHRVKELQQIFLESSTQISKVQLQQQNVDSILRDKVQEYFVRCSNSLNSIKRLHEKLIRGAKIILSDKGTQSDPEKDKFSDGVFDVLQTLTNKLKEFVSMKDTETETKLQNRIAQTVATKSDEAGSEYSLYRNAQPPTPVIDGFFNKPPHFAALIGKIQFLKGSNNFEKLCTNLSSYFTTILIEMHRDVQKLVDFCEFCSVLKQHKREQYSDLLRQGLFNMVTEASIEERHFYPTLQIIRETSDSLVNGDGTLKLRLLKCGLKENVTEYDAFSILKTNLEKIACSVFYRTNTNFEFYVFMGVGEENSVIEAFKGKFEIVKTVEFRNPKLKLAEIMNEGYAYHIESNTPDWMEKLGQHQKSFFSEFCVIRKNRATEEEFKEIIESTKSFKFSLVFYDPFQSVLYCIASKEDCEKLNGIDKARKIDSVNDMFSVPQELFYHDDVPKESIGQDGEETGITTTSRSEQRLNKHQNSDNDLSIYRSSEEVEEQTRKESEERTEYQTKLLNLTESLINKDDILDNYPMNAKSNVEVNVPYDYQLLLSKAAYALGIRNSLLVAQTGSGKTSMMFILLEAILDKKSKSQPEAPKICWVDIESDWSANLGFDLAEWSIFDTSYGSPPKVEDTTQVHINGDGFCEFANATLKDVNVGPNTLEISYTDSRIIESSSVDIKEKTMIFKNGIKISRGTEQSSRLQNSSDSLQFVTSTAGSWIVNVKGDQYDISFPDVLFVDGSSARISVDWGTLFPTQTEFPEFAIPFDKNIAKSTIQDVYSQDANFRREKWDAFFGQENDKVLLSTGLHTIKIKVGSAAQFYKKIFVQRKNGNDYFESTITGSPSENDKDKKLIRKHVTVELTFEDFKAAMITEHGIQCEKKGAEWSIQGFFVKKGHKNGEKIVGECNKHYLQDKIYAKKGYRLFQPISHALGDGESIAYATPASLYDAVQDLQDERTLALAKAKNRGEGQQLNENATKAFEDESFLCDEVHEFSEKMKQKDEKSQNLIWSDVSSLNEATGNASNFFNGHPASKRTRNADGKKSTNDYGWVLERLDFIYMFHSLNTFYTRIHEDMIQDQKKKANDNFEITFPPYTTKVSKVKEWDIKQDGLKEDTSTKKEDTPAVAEEMFIRWMRHYMGFTRKNEAVGPLSIVDSTGKHVIPYASLTLDKMDPKNEGFRIQCFMNQFKAANMKPETIDFFKLMKQGNLTNREELMNLCKHAFGNGLGKIDKTRYQLLATIPCYETVSGSDTFIGIWPSRRYMIKGPDDSALFPGNICNAELGSQRKLVDNKLPTFDKINNWDELKRHTLDKTMVGAACHRAGGNLLFDINQNDFSEIYESALFLMMNHNGKGPLARLFIEATRMFPVKPLTILNAEMGDIFEQYFSVFKSPTIFSNYSHLFYTTRERFSWLFSVSMYYYSKQPKLDSIFSNMNVENKWWIAHVQKLWKIGKCLVQQASLGFDIPVFVPSLLSSLLFNRAFVEYFAYRNSQASFCGFTATPGNDPNVIPAFLSLFSFKANYGGYTSLSGKLNAEMMTEINTANTFTLNYLEGESDKNEAVVLQPKTQYYRTEETFQQFLNKQNGSMFKGVKTWNQAREHIIYACLSEAGYNPEVPKIDVEKLYYLKKNNYIESTQDLLELQSKPTMSTEEKAFFDSIVEVLEHKEKTVILIHEEFYDNHESDFTSLRQICTGLGYKVFPEDGIAREIRNVASFNQCGPTLDEGKDSACYKDMLTIADSKQMRKTKGQRFLDGLGNQQTKRGEYTDYVEKQSEVIEVEQRYSESMEQQDSMLIFAGAKNLGTGLTYYGCRRCFLVGYDYFAKGSEEEDKIAQTLFAMIAQGKGRIRRLDSAVFISSPTDVGYHIFLPSKYAGLYSQAFKTNKHDIQTQEELSITYQAMNECKPVTLEQLEKFKESKQRQANKRSDVVSSKNSTDTGRMENPLIQLSRKLMQFFDDGLSYRGTGIL